MDTAGKQQSKEDSNPGSLIPEPNTLRHSAPLGMKMSDNGLLGAENSYTKGECDIWKDLDTNFQSVYIFGSLLWDGHL